MQKKKTVKRESAIEEKIEYLGLNFERVPNALIATENLNFKALKGYDEKQYKQYKYIKISDIDILLTPTHRMDSLHERYDEASPLYMYLDSINEENAVKYATFLKMLKKVEIGDVEKIKQEQERLAREIPYKVKFNGNYLWQIYYSEYSDRYFMLVPTEDSDYSTFFYLLKKKIENKKNEMIFVPISYLEYSGDFLKASDLKDLENYLWLFTKDYPSIYEVYDKKGNLSLQIIGETKVYGRIRTLYKMKFDTAKEAIKFFKLLKALFILQIGLPHYYNFTTSINDKGELQLFLDDDQVTYENLLEFVTSQYKKSVEQKNKTEIEIDDLKIKLDTLKKESIKLEKEYLEKEKTISTYLECKKTFFGKVKYFFSSGKKTKKAKTKKEKQEKIKESEKANIEEKQVENRNYTLDELIMSFKDLEISENSMKSIVQDINAIKLKNKNLTKKIENATLYINEINKHKKSIFEFWKYSNKDEVAALEEGEEEEVNISKIEKVFNFDEDFEAFGEKVDKNQRLKFTDLELDSSYIASTDLLSAVNDICNKKYVELQEYSKMLEKVRVLDADQTLSENVEFDIFGDDDSDGRKERTLGNKSHRESPRSLIKVLEIGKNTKPQDLKEKLGEISRNLKKAIKKNVLDEDIYVYKASNKELEFRGLETFSLNEESELQQVISKMGLVENSSLDNLVSENETEMDETQKTNEKDKKESIEKSINKMNEFYKKFVEDKQNLYNEILKNKKKNTNIYLYKIKLPKGSNFIAFSNIVLYNNKNMTLPVGMQESNRILVDTDELNLKPEESKKINVQYLQNKKDDFSDLVMKKIEIFEG